MEYLNRKEALLDAIAENGQTPEPMTREEALLKKIAEKACECLPAVDTEDNGKVLQVVEGAWTKNELPTPEPELPEVTSADNGKFLKVKSGKWSKDTMFWNGNIQMIETPAYLNSEGEATLIAFDDGELLDPKSKTHIILGIHVKNIAGLYTNEYDNYSVDWTYTQGSNDKPYVKVKVKRTVNGVDSVVANQTLTVQAVFFQTSV